MNKERLHKERSASPSQPSCLLMARTTFKFLVVFGKKQDILSLDQETSHENLTTS